MGSKLVLDFEKPVLELEKKIDKMRALSATIDLTEEIQYLSIKAQELREQIYKNLTRWQRVQIARHPDRPITSDYINNLFTDFIELHGDRKASDDKAIISGMANFNNIPVMIVGHQKGRDTRTNLIRNFGMPNPEGYRKASRLFNLAEKFGKPVISFIDTPGAFPGIEAEERGQAEAIARNLFQMSKLKVPIIINIIGEGASGGAIGIGVGDRVLMLENSWYSVISPESCSSILWKNWDFKEQAAEALKLTSVDLIGSGVIDRIIEEPIGGAHQNHEQMYDILKIILSEEITQLMKIPIPELVKSRREKLYKIGVFNE